MWFLHAKRHKLFLHVGRKIFSIFLINNLLSFPSWRDFVSRPDVLLTYFTTWWSADRCVCKPALGSVAKTSFILTSPKHTFFIQLLTDVFASRPSAVLPKQASSSLHRSTHSSFNCCPVFSYPLIIFHILAPA
jgi:hypothetical protein